nr:Uncharacterised protein [Escherichia coli]
MNMKKTLLVILTSISLAFYRLQVAATCPGRCCLQKPAAKPPGSGRAQPARHGHSGETDVASSLQSCLSRIKDSQHHSSASSPAWTKLLAIWKTRSVMPSWIG